MFKRKNNKGKIKVMIVCGSGIVTSSLVADKIEDMLDSSPYKYEIIKAGVGELARTKKKADVILTTCKIDEGLVSGIPVIEARGLLSGKTDEIKEKLMEVLDTIDKQING